MTFTRNVALMGNVGDVVAKDDSQMSVAHLLGMLVGVACLSVSHDASFLFAAFLALCPVHFYATLALVRAAEFQVLNQGKLVLMAEHWILHQEIPTEQQLEKQETWFGEFIHPHVNSTPLVMGATLYDTFDTLDSLEMCLDILSSQKYLLHYNKERMYLVYHHDATARDVISSVLHAIKYYRTWIKEPELEPAQLLKSTLEWTHSQQDYVQAMADGGWQIDAVFYGDSGHRATWSIKTE
jgi:hypothetical protein